MARNSPNTWTLIITTLMGRNTWRYRNSFSFWSLISLLWNAIHHCWCGWNAPRAHGRRTMYYIWLCGGWVERWALHICIVCVYMYIYIVCIIHKAWQHFNLTLNLRLTAFHSISSAITCMIAFSGGLSPLPLMAILQPEIRLVDSLICFSSLLIPLKGCWRVVFFFFFQWWNDVFS